MNPHRPELVIEVDMAELTVRIAEAVCGVKRPDGMTAEHALADLGETTAAQNIPDLIPSFERVAHAAMTYFLECIDEGTPSQ